MLGLELLRISANPVCAAENLKKAYDLRDRVSEREKYRISAFYYFIVTGELEKEAQTYELWIQSYPKRLRPSRQPRRELLGPRPVRPGVCRSSRGALHLTPNGVVGYQNLSLDLPGARSAR